MNPITMEKLIIPDHVVKVSDKWYKNNKTNKFIHADNIASFCDRYWNAVDGIKVTSHAKRSHHKNVESAKRRWNNE